MQRHREHPNHCDSGDCHPQSGGKLEGTVNYLEFQPPPPVVNSFLDLWKRLKY